MARTQIPIYQNIFVRSQELDNASWIKLPGVVVTADQAIAPDGTLTADLVDFTASSVFEGIYQAAGTGTSGKENTKSIWMKGVLGGEVVRLTDPTLGSVFTTCNLTTEWQRFVCLGTAGSLTVSNGIFLQKISGNQFYAWGGQEVWANWEGPYQVTTSSAVNTGNIRNKPVNRVAPAIFQNFFGHSEDFSHGDWTLSSCTIAANTSDTLDPLGGNTADKMLDTLDGGNVQHFISPTAILSSAPLQIPALTVSLYAKAGTLNFFGIRFIGTPITSFASFSLDGNYEVTTSDPSITAGMELVGNGWYRCWTTYRNLGGVLGSYIPRLYIFNASAGLQYTGTGTGAIYIWGAQAVAGITPGIYQQTVASIVNTGNVRNSNSPLQNLLKYSQEFDNVVGWTPAGTASVTPNTDIAPDGTLTADTLTLLATNDAIVGTYIVTIPNPDPWCFSVWMRAESPITVRLNLRDGTASAPGGILQEVKNVTTTWQRFNITTPISPGSGGMACRIESESGAKTVKIWGAQLTKSNQMGVYVKTISTIQNSSALRNLII